MQVISTEKLIVKKCCSIGFQILNEEGDCQSLWLQMTTPKYRVKGRGKKIVYGKQKHPGGLCEYSVWEAGIDVKALKAIKQVLAV